MLPYNIESSLQAEEEYFEGNSRNEKRRRIKPHKKSTTRKRQASRLKIRIAQSKARKENKHKRIANHRNRKFQHPRAYRNQYYYQEWLEESHYHFNNHHTGWRKPIQREKRAKKHYPHKRWMGPFPDNYTEWMGRTQGENGANEFTAEGVNELRVALFFALVRGIPQERLSKLIQLVMKAAKNEKATAKADSSGDIVADLFLMAFQTRHCRGGKGERDLFHRIILELVKEYPHTVEKLMCLVPHYGSFKDWFQITALADQDGNKVDAEVRRAMVPVVNTITNLALEQLKKDRAMLDMMEREKETGKRFSELSTGISLLAKWAPREKNQFKKQAEILAKKLFPESTSPKKEYRQLLSRLNKAINTPEVVMSANKWDEIDFNTVPSLCLMKHRKAFLNEKINERYDCLDEDPPGNRHPDDEKRVSCRKNLRDTMLQNNMSKLKGRQLFPHDIVSKLIGQRWGATSSLSTLEKDLFSCQWKDIRSSVIEAMRKVGEKDIGTVDADAFSSPSGHSVNLGNVVPLVDVSGSMSGTPMEVAIALGILVSEIASPAFANRCLTFSAAPQWVEFDAAMTLEQKVKKMERADWGMNTDFEKATENILQVAINAKLKPDEIPGLIVFSDMQFDEARNRTEASWETHHERIVRRFREEGIKACGEAWPAPYIVYWNLRGDTNGFPAQGDTPNVTMLSGYSPSLMKLLLDGEPFDKDIVAVNEDGVETIVQKKNPYTTVRNALDNEDYDKVRMVLTESDEGLLRFYKAPQGSVEENVIQVMMNKIHRLVVGFVFFGVVMCSYRMVMW